MKSNEIVVPICTSLTDDHGYKWMITAEAKGSVCYETNPCGLSKDHPYHGHEAGLYIEGVTISEVELNSNEGTSITKLRFNLLEDVPDFISESQLNKVRRFAKSKLLSKIESDE